MTGLLLNRGLITGWETVKSLFVGAKSAHDSRKLGLGAEYFVTDAVSSKRSDRPIEKVTFFNADSKPVLL